MPYREVQTMLREMVGEMDLLSRGSVLDSLERGVLYPVVHIDWEPHVTKVQEKEQENIHKVLYKEVDRVEPSVSKLNSFPRCFVMVGFKSLDTTVSPSLLNTWKDWTGANSIFLNLHLDFHLVKIIFYCSVKGDSSSTFTYLVVVEMANIRTDNFVDLLDFVQRTRVERLTGYISLYRELDIPKTVSKSREEINTDQDQKRRDSCTSVDSSFNLSDYDCKVFSTSYDLLDSYNGHVQLHEKQLAPVTTQEQKLTPSEQQPPNSFTKLSCQLVTAESSNILREVVIMK